MGIMALFPSSSLAGIPDKGLQTKDIGIWNKVGIWKELPYSILLVLHIDQIYPIFTVLANFITVL